MLKYCAKKIAQLLIVLVLISFFSFGIIYFAPGDVSSMYITQDMTDEQKEQVRKDLGLDRSMMEQYTEWAKRAVQGDFGVSLANKNSVAASGNNTTDGSGIVVVIDFGYSAWTGGRGEEKYMD